jgi:hypothetical protein
MSGESPFRQLLPADLGQLFPSLSHLFKLLSVSGRRSARHFAAFGRVVKIVLDFSHADTPQNTVHQKPQPQRFRPFGWGHLASSLSIKRG